MRLSCIPVSSPLAKSLQYGTLHMFVLVSGNSMEGDSP